MKSLSREIKQFVLVKIQNYGIYKDNYCGSKDLRWRLWRGIPIFVRYGRGKASLKSQS